MKGFIKWLANISGVTQQIEKQERKYIANRLIENAHWFNGGLMYKDSLENVSNFATLYGESLKKDVYPDVSNLRDALYKMSEQDLSVYHDREVYGYWSNDRVPHFIEKEKYNGEEGYTPQLRTKYK